MGQREMDLSQETNSILINWSRHSYHFVSILLQIRENFSRYIYIYKYIYLFFLAKYDFFEDNFFSAIFYSAMGLVCHSFNYMYLRKNKIEHLYCFLSVKPQLLKLNPGVKTEAEFLVSSRLSVAGRMFFHCLHSRHMQ